MSKAFTHDQADFDADWDSITLWETIIALAVLIVGFLWVIAFLTLAVWAAVSLIRWAW